MIAPVHPSRQRQIRRSSQTTLHTRVRVAIAPQLPFFDVTMSKPRYLTDSERAKILEFQDMIHYSPRYSDDINEYRHVMLPKNMLKAIPQDYFNPETGTLRILHEDEWRGLGITQSLGWAHYEAHAPEPHILLFKRPINYSWLCIIGPLVHLIYTMTVVRSSLFPLLPNRYFLLFSH